MSEQQQWSDERIAESLPSTYLYSCWWTDKDEAIALAQRVRNDMQAEIAGLSQELTEAKNEIEALRQQLTEAKAGPWEPVEEGVHAQMGGDTITVSDEARVLDIRSTYGDGSPMARLRNTMICLAENYRLCQLVEAEWLDAPDSEGWWAHHSGYESGVVRVWLDKDDAWIRAGPYQPAAPVGAWNIHNCKWQRLNIVWPGEGGTC